MPINYIRNDDKKFIETNNGLVPLPNPSDEFDIYSGIEDSIAFLIISNKESSEFDPTVNTVNVTLTFVNPNTNEMSGPFLIYESQNQNLSIYGGLLCNSLLNTNYHCVFGLREGQKRYVIKRSFLHTGLV